MKLAHLQIEAALWRRSGGEERRKWLASRPRLAQPADVWHARVMRTIHSQLMNFNEIYYESIHISYKNN